MINKINNPMNILPDSQKNGQKTAETGDAFQNTLSGLLEDVNQSQVEADEAADAFLKGDITDLHQVTIAAEKARLSLELLLEIRNKMMESYQEIMRMQL